MTESAIVIKRRTAEEQMWREMAGEKGHRITVPTEGGMVYLMSVDGMAYTLRLPCGNVGDTIIISFDK